MTDPAFTIKEIRRTDPFRSRNLFAHCLIFDDGDVAVFVGPQTAQKLSASASSARPNETGGLLSGRTFRDSAGAYVVVEGFVEAKDSAGVGLFEMSPRENERLRGESAQEQPMSDVVGWWHSHQEPSEYSETDRATQRVWTQPTGVGLLVFARGTPWARAYAGPDAIDLGLPHAWDGSRRPRPPVSPSARQADEPRSMPSGRRPTRAVSPAVVVLAAIGIIISLALLAAVYATFARVSSEQRQLSRQIAAGQRDLGARVRADQQRVTGELTPLRAALTAGPSIGSSCVSDAAAPGTYLCNAATSAPASSIVWKLDGKSAGSGKSVTIRVPSDGRSHTIQAFVKTPAGTYAGVAQSLPS
jgi:proteasome lid subunit RPN8/RPN11